MIIKINIDPLTNKKIIAICDSSLLGKIFSEGKFELNLNSNFFMGEEKEEGEILKILNKYDGLNIVGKKSIEFAIKFNLIDKDNVGYINKIPYAFTTIIKEENQF